MNKHLSQCIFHLRCIYIRDEVLGWYHRFNGHELGHTPGDGEGQGSLACCSSWGHEESDMTW